MFSNFQWISTYLGDGEFLPSNVIQDTLADLVCKSREIELICENIIFLLCGFDEAEFNKTMAETLIHHLPAGTSVYTVVHYAQEILSEKFQKFDYGIEGNRKVYGQDEPPEYKIEAIKAPIAAYWSENDWLAQPDDVLRLMFKLPNHISSYKVPMKEWNHLDFLYGIDAKTLLYPEVLKNMEKFKTKY